jgi:hypothetical protein
MLVWGALQRGIWRYKQQLIPELGPAVPLSLSGVVWRDKHSHSARGARDGPPLGPSGHELFDAVKNLPPQEHTSTPREERGRNSE